MKSLGTTTPQKSLIDPAEEDEAFEPHKDAITVGRIIIDCDILKLVKIT